MSDRIQTLGILWTRVLLLPQARRAPLSPVRRDIAVTSELHPQCHRVTSLPQLMTQVYTTPM